MSNKEYLYKFIKMLFQESATCVIWIPDSIMPRRCGEQAEMSTLDRS